MASRIEQLITEIEDYIENCKAQAFTNNKKIIVDKDEMEELLVELRLRVPDEIKKYQKIISNQDAILATAKENAEKTVSSAEAEADKTTKEARMEAEAVLADAHFRADSIMQESEQQSAELISEHEIMQQAYEQAGIITEQATEQANSIVEDANAQAAATIEQVSAQAQKMMDDAVAYSNEVREGAIRYADDMLGSLQSIIGQVTEQSEGRFNSMLEALNSSYDVITANRRELQLPVQGTGRAADEPKQTKAKDLNADMLN